MFGALKRVMGSAATQVKAEYGENKDFLEACCAACALVAAADGDIEDSERQKATRLITNHAALSKIYKQQEIETTLEMMFRRAKDASGRAQLARELDDLKGRPNGRTMAEDVYLLAVDVSMADGEQEPQEKVVLDKLAKRMDVDTTKFDF